MLALKLYVWEGFNPDYTPGLAFAVAKTERTARKLIIKERNGYEPYCWGDLSVYDLDKEIAKSVSGGS